MKKIYALQAVDVGWEDPKALSEDLEALKKWALEQDFGHPIYIVKGEEIAPGIFTAPYDGKVVWEWEPEEQKER